MIFLEFEEAKYKANQEPYNKLLEEVAKSGINPYTWKDIKKFIIFKANSVISEFWTKNVDIEPKEAFEEKLKTVLEPLNHFIET